VSPVASLSPREATQVNDRRDINKLRGQMQHLFYEAWMLDETRKRLLAGVNDEVLRNAMIESFCAHAHNLNEFFGEEGLGDTLKASSFTRGDYKWPATSEKRKALITKINKRISHLTQQRTLVAKEEITDQDMTALYELLVADLKKFMFHLRPELRVKPIARASKSGDYLS